MIEIHWIWILVAAMGCGSLGCLAMGVLAATRMKELILANRKLQRQRDDAVKDLNHWIDEAKNHRELLKEKQ